VNASAVRVGFGFDTHAWGLGRALYLGGARFDGELGLGGHSDGDVVCHAVGDALLGAVALGDVGEHFPDTDPQYEGIAGLDLLSRVVAKVADLGFRPEACDLTVLAARPVVGPRREEMRRNLAAALSVPVTNVSVKATRPEGLGLQGDGIGCMAVAQVVPIGSR